MDTPGIHLAKRIDKMGMRGSDTAVIYLDDVRVPAKNIIGEAGMGFTYQMLQFQEERLGMNQSTLTVCVNTQFISSLILHCAGHQTPLGYWQLIEIAVIIFLVPK